MNGDSRDVTCSAWQDAISAHADGEPSGVDRRLLDAHVARCPDCRRFRDSIAASHRQLRIGEAPSIPDLSRQITKRHAVEDRRSVWQVARWGLAVVAVQIIGFSVPALLGREQGASTHSARHLGAFTVAYGVGLLVAVIRPARARTVLPVAAVLAGALLITALVDLLGGHAPFSGELTHLPELVSFALLWLLLRPAGSPAVTADDRSVASARAALRSVPTADPTAEADTA